MSNPSEFSFLNKIEHLPFPAGGIVPTGVITAARTQLTGLISGTIDGTTFAEIDDSGQDSENATDEVYPGRVKPFRMKLTFRFNSLNLAALLAAGPPTGQRVPPAMGRRLFIGTTPSGIEYRQIGFLQVPTFLDIPDNNKHTIEVEVVGSGICVVVIPPTLFTVTNVPPPIPPAAP